MGYNFFDHRERRSDPEYALMFNWVDVDFDPGQDLPDRSYPEFIELFRMGLKNSRWKERELGMFDVI